MVARPQWRLLEGGSREPRAAPGDGPALWLRRRQCRGADARSAFPAELDTPRAGGAQGAPGLRPRRPALPLSEEPKGLRLSARARRRNHSLRRQSLAFGAGLRTRSVRIRRPPPGRDARQRRLSGNRSADLSDHAAALRLLLVRPRRGRASAVLARPDARADARLYDLRAQGQRGRDDHAAIAPRIRNQHPAVLPRQAALVRGQGSEARKRQHRLHRADRERPRGGPDGRRGDA